MQIPKTAVYLGLTAALISGCANFVNKIAISGIDPVFYTFLKNGLVAIFLLGVLVLGSQWRQFRHLSKADWLRLVAIGVVGGSIPFILFFTGLQLTSAVSASLIHKTLFIWVVALAVPFLGERLGKIQWMALALLLFGNFFLGSWQQLKFGQGEVMILAATILWAIENVIARRTLQNVSASAVAAARMVLGSSLLLLVVYWQGNLDLMTGLTIKQWSWTIVTSVLLFGYVMTWYSALAKASVSVVASLLVPASLVTGLLALIFQNKAFTNREILSAGMILLAVGLMIWSGRRARKSLEYVASSGRQS